MHDLKWYFGADDASIGGGSAPDATTDTSGATDTTPAAAPGAGSDATPTKDPDPKPKTESRAQTRIRELNESNKTLQAQIDALKSGKPTGQHTGDIMDHPLLKGMEINEHGEVSLKGVFVTPEFAIQHLELEQTVKAVNDKVASHDQNRLSAEAERNKQEMYAEGGRLIVQMREDLTGKLTDDSAAIVDQFLLQNAETRIGKEMAAGKQFSAEMVQAVGKSVLEDAKKMFGVFGVQQFKENQEHAAKVPGTRADGQVGVSKAEDEMFMTKAQRQEVIRQRQKLAEAARSNG